MAASTQLSLFAPTGALVLRADYALTPPVALGARGDRDAPIVVATGMGGRDIVAIDPVRGDATRVMRLPGTLAGGKVFATAVHGRRVIGLIVGSPLRALAL